MRGKKRKVEFRNDLKKSLKKNRRKKSAYRHTAYDDAFRTLEQECNDALLCFVNEMFNENYDETAEIERLKNEHFIQKGKGKTEKRISDSHFKITYHNISKIYHIECESRGYDESILIRLIEYSIYEALGDRINTHEKIRIKIPYTGLLVLRDSGTPPEKILLEIESPDADVLSYEATVMCMTEYSLEDIFSKGLYFLIPFFCFNLEDNFDEYESNTEKLNEFEKIYCDIIERLKNTNEADLSLRSKGIIIEEMKNVLNRLAYKHKNIMEKVGDIMGGKPHKLKWLEKYDAAVAKGRAEGRSEGLAEGRSEGLAEGEKDRARLVAEIHRLKAENERLRAVTGV